MSGSAPVRRTPPPETAVRRPPRPRTPDSTRPDTAAGSPGRADSRRAPGRTTATDGALAAKPGPVRPPLPQHHDQHHDGGQGRAPGRLGRVRRTS
ncbi:hypothetical protein DUI70_0954 [Streptomyces albus]|nr:hypothetical protein DUI70_0954 [Streptomyces albus]